MKKLRLLSLILASLMVLSLVPALFVTTASAATTVTAQPTVLPSGTAVANSKEWINWSTLTLKNTNGSITSDGYLKIAVGDQLPYPSDNKVPQTTAWRGAEGIMFYVDASEAEANKKVDFMVEVRTYGNRPKDASSNGNVVFWNTPAYWADTSSTGGVKGAHSVAPNSPATAYYYDQSAGWVRFIGGNDGKNNLISGATHAYYPQYTAGTSGWYYIPFDSFYCHGGNGTRHEAALNGMKFLDFMEVFQEQKLYQFAIKSNNKGLKFGNVSFVYPEIENLSSGVSAPLFGTPAQNGNPEGTASSSISNGNIVIGGMTGNSATASGNRIWLKGLQNTSLVGAEGIRFHVDTRALGEAALNVRLRLRCTGGPNVLTDTIYANNKSGFATSSVASLMQFVTRTDASVMYYYDANGVAQPLYTIDASDAQGGDLFNALPVGYVGDVYIPMDSYWVSWGSYANATLLPWDLIASKYNLDLIAICHAFTDTPTKAEVTYSNFEIVYDDAAITGANITLTENFDLNFFAKADATVTDLALTYSFNNETAQNWTLTANGTEQKFSYTDILPQEIGDNMVVTLSGKINGVAVKQVVNYSILQYCKNKITAAENSELAALLKAVLNYGANAQTVANYKTDALVNKGYEDTTVVTNKTVTNAKNATTNDAAKVNDYHFTGAAARLESSLALRLNMSFASAEGVTVEINGAAVPFTAAGAANAYTLVWEGINANGYDEKITAVIKVNGTAVQTLTYSINAYLANVTADSYSTTAEMKALANSIYNYGVAAAAYSATLASLGK